MFASPLTGLKLTLLAAMVLVTGTASIAMPVPVGWQPHAPACHFRFTASMSPAEYFEMPCTTLHVYQTVYVGKIVGATANRAQPPKPASAEYQALWADCDPRLSAFLGGSWHERRLRLHLALPTSDGWSGGSRWYSCEAEFVFDDISPEHLLSATLQAAFDLPVIQFGCYVLSEGVPALGPFPRRACDKPHNVEFVGAFESIDMSFADMSAGLENSGSSSNRRCAELIYAFVGIAPVRVGIWLNPPEEEDWNAGDRTVRCFLWLGDTMVSTSLKGVGPAGWPLK